MTRTSGSWRAEAQVARWQRPRRGLLLGLPLLFAFLFNPGEVLADWTKYDNNTPANSDGACTNGKIPLGSSGKGDDIRVSIPFVFKDTAPDTFKMWYTGNDGALWRIYYATAPVPPPAGTFYFLR